MGGGEAVILDREERCANPHCGRRLYRKFQAVRKGDKVFCPGCTA